MASNTHSSDCDETKGGNVVACDCLSVYLENIATFFFFLISEKVMSYHFMEKIPFCHLP